MLKASEAAKDSNIFFMFFIYIFMLGLVQIPIWSNEYLPIQDYPNHLARMHIILNIHHNIFLQKYYDVTFHILPNLAMDIITTILAHFFPLEIAGRLMLVLVFVTITSGSIFLNYALFKKITIFSFIPFLLMFNEAFIKGFINFLFGIGLAIWCIGLWIIMRQTKHWLRLGLFSLISSLIFICHLYAFGFYAITIVCYEISILFKNKNFAVFEILTNFSQFIVPIILYYCSPTSAGKSLITYSTLTEKLLTYPFKIFSGYSFRLSVLTMAGMILILIIGLSRKEVKFSNLMLLPLIALILIYLLLPHSLSSSTNADWRMVIPLVLLLISTVNIKPTFYKNKIINFAFPAYLIVLLALNVATVNGRWMSLHNEYKEILMAIENIEEGSRLFSARRYGQDYGQNTIPFMHAPTYAIIRKSAFVPSLFALATQQPVSFNKNYTKIVEKTGSPAYSLDQEVDWNTVISEYDYVLLSKKQLVKNIPQTSLSKVFEKKYSLLYKVNPYIKIQMVTK